MENETLKEPLIVIEDLHKSYGKKEVLKGLSLSVFPGEVFGFIGKNGAGKSTTIDCMVGLKNPNSGSISLCGFDTKKSPLDAKSVFGYASSEPIAYEMMSGNDYLQFVAGSYEMKESSYRANRDFLVKKLDLTEEEMSRRIGTYSHGMKQKVCLMASLIQNPKIWILDEPTVGLDIMVYEVLLRMIKEFANGERAVFVTSHSIDLVSKVCDRVGIVNNGVVDTLIDFHKEPLKRRDLPRIFLEVYKEKGEKDAH